MADRHQKPSRHVRVPDGRWNTAKDKAKREGKTISDVVNDCLDRYNRKESGKGKGKK